MTTQQKFQVDLSDFDMTPAQKREFADLAIERIYDRSNDGKHLDSAERRVIDMPKYSDSYAASLDFKIAGKRKGKPDLQLSGDMLASIKLLRNTKDGVEIGFPAADKKNNGKAEGNILGTYGSDTPNPRKARRFLGLTPAEIKAIARVVLDG